MNLRQLIRTRPRVVALVPLVDVVFILLLFFMLSSSFIQKRQIPMHLPEVSTGAVDTQVMEVELLTNEGRLKVNGREYVGFDTSPLMSKSFVTNDHVIAIRSSASVKLQALVTLLDRLAKEGLVKVALVE